MALETAIERASYKELRHIVAWLRRRHRAKGGEPGVLVGGWAVYCYNPYLGSIDIDLIMNARTRKSLSNWLIEERGFARHRTSEYGWQAVRKPSPDGGWIVADFGNRSEVYRFEGRTEALSFDVLDGRTLLRPIEGIDVHVPDRSLLLLFKLKAVHDRTTRLARQGHDDAEWDRAKRVKDLADVLALVDSARGGNDLSVGFLGNQLQRFPFLGQALEAAGDEPAAIERYGGMTPRQARDRTGVLKGLLT